MGTGYKNKTRGGFEKSANFVSQYLTEKDYDEFVADCLGNEGKAESIELGKALEKAEYIYKELFEKRNRIMHRGDMSYGREDAANGLAAAKCAISVLNILDREKCSATERERHSS